MRNVRPADMTAQRFKCLIDIYNCWIFRGIPAHFQSSHSDQPATFQPDFKARDNRHTLAHVGIQHSFMGVSDYPGISIARVSPLFSGVIFRDQRGREINAPFRKRPFILKNNYSSKGKGSAIDSHVLGIKTEHSCQWRDGP